MKILREGWSAVGWEKSGIEKWDHNLCWEYSWDLELQKSIMTRCWFKMPRGIEELRDQKKCSPHYQSEHKFLRKKFKNANWSLFFEFSHNRQKSNFDINRAQFEKKIFRATVEIKFKAEISKFERPAAFKHHSESRKKVLRKSKNLLLQTKSLVQQTKYLVLQTKEFLMLHGGGGSGRGISPDGSGMRLPIYYFFPKSFPPLFDT